MGWPSKKEIERVLTKIEKENLWTQGMPANPTLLQKFRHDIQQKFVVYKRKAKISQREMAEILGVDEGKVSKILHNHLEEFSTDRLINLYTKIDPEVKLKVS